MPKNWKTYKLEDAIEVLIDYRGKTPKKTSYGIPLVTAKIVKRGAIQEPKEFIAVEDYDKWMVRGFPKIGDVVLTTEAPLGEVAIIKNDNIALAQRIVTLRGAKNILDSTYLKYFLQSSIGQNRLVARESGTTVTGIKQTELRKVLIDCPPYEEQTQIANILSAIDDKIENNLGINKTLEDMAMALYKHWFVDFGPFQDGEFVESELGRIPKGWEVKRLTDFCTLTMGQSPKSKFYNNIKEGLPFHQGVKDYGERFPSDETYSTEGKRLAEKDDVLFSVRAPVGRLNIAKNEIILGRGLASIRMNNSNHFGFLFYALKTRFTEDDIIGDGTVYKSVNKSDLQNLKFLISSEQLIKDFNHIVKPSDEKYLNNFNENQNLTELRDTLLPKLISGEVRLKEFKEEIQTVL